MEKNCVVATLEKNEDKNKPLYSIKEVSELTGISVFTLRFYDNKGLFPFLHRDEKNRRIFSNADLEWIRLVECLREGDMSIENIQNYLQLCKIGDSVLEERYEIIKRQGELLENQITHLMKSLEHIKVKQKYYEEKLKI